MYASSSSSTAITNPNAAVAAAPQNTLPQRGALTLSVQRIYESYDNQFEGYRRQEVVTEPYTPLKVDLGIYTDTMRETGVRRQCELLFYYANEMISHLEIDAESEDYHRIGTEFAAKSKAPAADEKGQIVLSKAVNLSMVGAGYDFKSNGAADRQPFINPEFARMGGQNPFEGKSVFALSKTHTSSKYATRFRELIASLKSKCGPLLQEQPNKIEAAKREGDLPYAEQIVHYGKLILIASETDTLANNPNMVRQIHASITQIDGEYKSGKVMSMADLNNHYATIRQAENALIPTTRRY